MSDDYPNSGNPKLKGSETESTTICFVVIALLLGLMAFAWLNTPCK